MPFIIPFLGLPLSSRTLSLIHNNKVKGIPVFLVKTSPLCIYFLQNFLRERGDITENRRGLINAIIKKIRAGSHAVIQLIFAAHKIP